MKRIIATTCLMIMFAAFAVAQETAQAPEPEGTFEIAVTQGALFAPETEAAFSIAFAQDPTPAPERGNVIYKTQGPMEGGMRMRMQGPMPPGMPGMGAWWKNSDIAKELNLTDAQKKQLEQTFLDYRLKLIDLNADLERQELKLEPLIDADSPDMNTISTQLDQVVAARGRLEKSNALMSVAMRKVLSQEQWKKLQGMHRMRVPMAPRAPGLPRIGPPPVGAGPAMAPETPKAPSGKEPL